MKSTIVLYHGNCIDGFTAAWCAWKHFPEWQYVPCVYNKPVPVDVTDSAVYLLDFSYPESVMRDMAQRAASVTVLDHHKTAQEALQPLLADGTIGGTFDMSRSGAVMAWQYFNHRDAVIPEIIQRVQDYDLWTHAFSNSRAIHSALGSYRYDFELWDFLMNADSDSLAYEGSAILRSTEKSIDEMMPHTHWMYVTDDRGAGYKWIVPALNVPYMWASLAGEKLAGEHDGIGAAWYQDADGNRVVSLRSRKRFVDEKVIDAPDVSAIAKRHGGGGHAGAAGFTIAKQDVSKFFGAV